MAQGNSQRASFLKEAMHEIRAKRLSLDAPAKGLYPARTPSIPLLSRAPSKQENNKESKYPPILSLTKLDFELLREWNWNDRKERLDSWRRDLGLARAQQLYKVPGAHGQGRHSLLRGSTDVLGQSHHSRHSHGRHSHQRHSHHHHHHHHHHHTEDGVPVTRRGKHAKDKVGPTRAILQGELAQLVGRKIRPPDTMQGLHKTRHHQHHHHHYQSKSSALGVRDIFTSSVSSANFRRKSHEQISHEKGGQENRNVEKDRAAIYQEALEKKDRKLEKVVDKAKAIELKSTFGKAWDRRRVTKVSQKSDSKSERKDRTSSPPTDSQLHYRHPHQISHELKTDVEEEQPSTSYFSHTSRGPTDMSSQVESPTGSADSLGLTALFKSMHEKEEDIREEDENDSSEGDDEGVKNAKAKFMRPRATEYQDTCFGSIKFVDVASVKPTTKKKRDKEFYMTFDDTDLSLALGNTQHLKVRFFKAGGAGRGRSDRILAREQNQKLLRQKQEEMKLQKALEEEEERNEIEKHKNKAVIKSFSELPTALELNKEDRKKYAEKLAEFEKAVLKIPGIGSNYRIEIEPVSAAPSGEIPPESKVPRRNQYTRPPRRVWYTPLPLAVKKYYRTNWKKIRFDVRHEMRERHFWPKLWINFEESHPKKMLELIRTKLALKQFDAHGFKREYDWGRGVHPDFIDWILEDIVPHPGKYYYDEETRRDAVKRASFEDSDFAIKDWFRKPPRYIPNTPPSPPFDQFDFCGYGTRENSYFLDFTLPREILHYYAPPSKIEEFFRQIPKPPYAFPGYTFKRWLKYPLEKKLPQYFPFPKRFSIWTRGKIGDSIRVNSTNFKLDDPLFQKADLNYNPYHDPHARKYFLKKHILDRLWELGIINSKGEVKCTMKEFNQNRRYLRDYEWLDECLRRWTMKWVSRLEHNRVTKDTNIAMLDWDSKNRIRQQRLYRCQAYRKIRDEEEEKINKERERRYQAAVDQIMETKNQLRLAMIARGKIKRKEQRARKKILLGLRQGRVLLMQYLYKEREKKALKYRKSYQLTKIVTQVEKQKNAWNRRVEFARRKMEEMKELQEQLEHGRWARVELRKQNMKKYWRDVPFAIERHKRHVIQDKLRWLELAAKYFNIWLTKTRERKKLYEKGDHDSIWNPQHVMQTTVHELKERSHYVKVENFIFLAVKKHLEAARHSMDSSTKSKENKGKYRRGSVHFQVEREMNRLIRENKGFRVSEETHLGDDEDYIEKEKFLKSLKPTPIDETDDEEDDGENDQRPETKGYEGDIEETPTS